MITIPPGLSRLIAVRYTPDSSKMPFAILKATDVQCRFSAAVQLRIDVQNPNVTLASNSFSGEAPVLSGRPGDNVEIPLFLLQNVDCVSSEMRLSFDLQFDVFSLSPNTVSAIQGTASMRRLTPDKIRITVAGAKFTQGELARIKMEILIGRTSRTTYMISNPVFEPPLVEALLDGSSEGSITIKPRNGVTTLDDLGISFLSAPKPNIVVQSGMQKTTISFNLEKDSYVDLRVMNQLGVEVAAVYNGWMPGGRHEIEYIPSNLPSGLYLVTMTDGTGHYTQKLILAR